MTATIGAVCVSSSVGCVKTPVSSGILIPGYGFAGDAHAGTWHRQISLLSAEAVREAETKHGRTFDPGVFAENLRTEGIPDLLTTLPVGIRFRVGPAILQVTQHGKECHHGCAIRSETGDCIMPRQGIFARVRQGGVVVPGDAVTVDPLLQQPRIAVITVSDRSAAGSRADASGPLAADMLRDGLNAHITETTVVPDDRRIIAATLRRLSDTTLTDVIITTGGTGFAPRDVTPEATAEVCRRRAEGLIHGIIAGGLHHTPKAVLSRATAGIRGQTLVINLSGSPKAVKEQLAIVMPLLPHAMEVLSGAPLNCGS